MKLTKDAQTAVEVVTTLGGSALLVGGCVRDHLLGIEPKDIDIEVHGSVSPVHLVAELRKHGRVDTVGISFGVIKFGTDVDISFPRRDSKAGTGHTGFTIEFDQTMSIPEALHRRDFTINSIAIDAVTGQIHDPFHGQDDLRHGVIRHTSWESFADDPLRVLRAIQFASRFDFSIANDTARLAQTIFDEFHTLSVERVWAEWEKILTKGQSMKAVTDALVKTGWISHFPEWGVGGQVTDRVLRIERPTGARREAMILGTQFAGRVKALDKFLERIDAPTWLRRQTRKLASGGVATGDIARDARFISRELASIPFKDWVACHRLWGTDLAAQDECLPIFVTGQLLIGLGLKPGPEFGGIIKEAQWAQDTVGWKTEEEALQWLQAIGVTA